MTAKELAQHRRHLASQPAAPGRPIAAADPQEAPAPAALAAGRSRRAAGERAGHCRLKARDLADLQEAARVLGAHIDRLLAAQEQKGSRVDVGSDVPGGGAA